MRILSIEVENVLGCREATVDFSAQRSTVIGGGNFQGKTSCLTAIRMCLGGKRCFPKNPITAGEDYARIVMKTEPDENDSGIPWPATIVRTLNRKEDNPNDYSTKVEINATDEDSLPEEERNLAQTTQKLLDEYVGDGMTFNPLKFVDASATEQANILRALTGIDFTKIDEDRERIYARRSKVNLKVKMLDGQIQGMQLPDNMPAEPVDVSEVTARLKSAHDFNTQREAKYQQAETVHAKMKATRDKMEALQAQYDAAQREMEALVEESETLNAETAGSEPFDTSPIERELEEAGRINQLFTVQRQSLELREQRKGLRTESEGMTRQIKALDKKKRDMSAKAKWPVPGLGFSPQGVTLNDTPFSSLSSAEQMRCAIGIQIRKNGLLPLAIIQDGSLLNIGSMIDVAETVVKLGGQAIVERVTEAGEHRDCHYLFYRGRCKHVDDLTIEEKAEW